MDYRLLLPSSGPILNHLLTYLTTEQKAVFYTAYINLLEINMEELWPL
jgi:hypothetical protein